MHTLRHGPTMRLVTNHKTNKEKEVTVMKKFQAYKAPKVILAIKDKAAEIVANHYKKYEKDKSIPPAPDWFEEKGEE